MDPTQTKALAIDGVYVAVVGSSPLWMQGLEQWSVLAIIGLALILGCLRIAVAWRDLIRPRKGRG